MEPVDTISGKDIYASWIRYCTKQVFHHHMSKLATDKQDQLIQNQTMYNYEWYINNYNVTEANFRITLLVPIIQ